MWIKNYILTLIAVVIFTSFLEILMPSSNMKKHISLIAGIVMILAISKPVIKMPGYLLNEMSFRLENIVEPGTVELSEKVNEVQNKLIENDFSKELVSALQLDINRKFNKNYELEVIIEGNTVKSIVLYGEEREDVSDYVRKTYGFECLYK